MGKKEKRKTVSGPECKKVIHEILKEVKGPRHAFMKGVHAMCDDIWGEMPPETDEEVETRLVAWVEKEFTWERFIAALGYATANKGVGVCGWNEYLLKKADTATKEKYLDALKNAASIREWPTQWKEWTATFAMKPKEDPRELLRRRDLWSLCSGLKVVGRILGAMYDEKAEEVIPMPQGGFTKCSGTARTHLPLPLQRKQCQIDGRPCLRGYVDMGGYFMSIVRKVQKEVERRMGIQPELTLVMMSLHEGSKGRAKTGFGKTDFFEIAAGLGQGDVAAAIRSKYTTALIQQAVNLLCGEFDF